MEQVGKALQKVNLENSSKISKTIRISNSLSVYSGSLTTKGIATGAAMVLKAFPKFDKNQLSVLKARFKANKFTDQRIIDAVNNVIDTYEGWDKLPNIANFIQFDRHCITYNQAIEYGLELCEIHDKDRGLWRKKDLKQL